MLKEFFAVTVSGSLYRVSDEISENGWPTVQRMKGPNNPCIAVGSHLRNGRLVGIGNRGICLFDPSPKYGRSFENMNTAHFGGSTSDIVGLFLKRAAAEACLASGDRTPMNQRYHKPTQAVLDAILDNHPAFVVGSSLRWLAHLLSRPRSRHRSPRKTAPSG